MQNLTVNNICFKYGDQFLFKNWSANIPKGVVLIHSEESRGKSTLLRILAGALQPESGDIFLDDISASKSPQLFQSRIFHVEPSTEAFDQITAMDFFARCKTQYPEFDEQKLNSLIQGLSLSAHKDKPIYMLSAGTKRKVWIAAAIASNARVALIDDLTAALDKGSIDFLTSELANQALNSQNKTIVVAHYDALDNIPLALTISL